MAGSKGIYPNLEMEERGEGRGHRGEYRDGGPESVRVTTPILSDAEQKWKPVFDKYDEQKKGEIPLDDLRRHLSDQCENDKCGINASKRAKILEEYDHNKDGHIDYHEFARMMSGEDTRWRRLVWFAAGNVIPKSMQDDEFINYIDKYNCMPPPIFILLVSVVEISVYIYYCVTLEQFTVDAPAPIGSPLIYSPVKREEVWRFLTYMLIHIGYVHIIFNILIQLVLGLPLELVHKFWRVSLIYLVGVIAGSLGTSVVDPNTYLAGASGGVYAILAAHLANIIMNWKEMPYNWVRLLFLLVLSGTDVGVAIWNRYKGDGTGPKVGYAAHFAGALAGLLIGVTVLKNLKVRKWERVVWWVSLILAIILLVFAVVWNIAYPDFPTARK